MKTIKQLVFFVAGCLLLASCNKPSEPVATFDLEKAKAGVTATNQKFMDAVSRGDSLALAACYHSEGMIMPPNMEPISGKDNIIAFQSVMIKMGIAGFIAISTEVWGNEENVYEVGTYELFGKDKTSIDKGKYLVVWKQENGEWKLYRDMFSSNLPLPAPPSK